MKIWLEQLVSFKRWALDVEGSTRSAALIRIGLVGLIWARWGNELLLYKQIDDWQTVMLCVNNTGIPSSIIQVRGGNGLRVKPWDVIRSRNDGGGSFWHDSG